MCYKNRSRYRTNLSQNIESSQSIDSMWNPVFSNHSYRPTFNYHFQFPIQIVDWSSGTHSRSSTDVPTFERLIKDANRYKRRCLTFANKQQDGHPTILSITEKFCHKTSRWTFSILPIKRWNLCVCALLDDKEYITLVVSRLYDLWFFPIFSFKQTREGRTIARTNLTKNEFL